MVYACMACAMVWNLQQVEYSVNLELSGHSAASGVKGRLDIVIVPRIQAPRHDRKLRPVRRPTASCRPPQHSFTALVHADNLMAAVTMNDRGSCVPSVARNHPSVEGLVPCFSECHIVHSS